MKLTNETLTHLDVFLGDKCNLRCIACDCWLNEEPFAIPSHVLESRLKDILNHLEMHCPNFDKLMIIGGEPFCHEGLASFLANLESSIYIVIYTNFSIPLGEYSWPDNVHFITSLDAPNDRIYRKIRRGRTFTTTIENINLNRDHIIHMDTTVSKLNVGVLDDLVEISESVGCTHWFLPVDPRVIRYSKEREYSPKIAASVRNLNCILLQEEDLESVREFYRKHTGNTRLNDFSMFSGLFLSGIRHYEDLKGYGKDIANRSEIVTEEEAEQELLSHCPGLESYIEVGISKEGYVVPILHCLKQRELVPKDTIPAFSTIEDLIDWFSNSSMEVKCDSYCGRTQFLALDSYKDLFSKTESVSK
ncbi:MAG: radical SAM protein [Candidatus Thorarchaeota archaeon]|nr:radical SAM protein [Candidatus Thorarchaeota archaeon]